MIKKLVVLIFTVFAIGGCSTYAANRYSVSMDSQAELESVADASPDHKVAVDPFTASEPGKTESGCRAVGPIKTPDGETFETYIQKALIDQLRLAHLYKPDSPLRLSGNLDELTFSSHEGMWHLILTIIDNTSARFTVREDYGFKSSYYGETACNQTAQAFMPAVQNLIKKVVSDPVFKEMIATKDSVSLGSGIWNACNASLCGGSDGLDGQLRVH